MQLLSVNVSKPKNVPYRGETLTTGIYKQPATGRVALRQLNLDGDGQADLNVHGGIHKAAYVYPFEHYAFWSERLGRDDFAYGQFGENFTTTGLLEDEVYIGDVYRVGSALVEVTQPRVPCFKLAHKIGEPTFVKQFMQAERTGFYLRVVQEGEVGAGDTIERVQFGPEQMSVRHSFRLLYVDHADLSEVERAHDLAALSPGWREAFAEIIEKTLS